MTGIAGVIGHADYESAKRSVRAMIVSLQQNDDDIVNVVSSPESNACIASCCLAGSFSSQVSAQSTDRESIAFAGELFPTVHSPGEESRHTIWSAYRDRGSSAVQELNGLFSCALIDPGRNRTALFNDRYGSERIYIHEKGSCLYFASQAKALLAVLPELKAWDLDGVTQYLAFGSTVAEKTLFSGITVLPGGSLWEFDKGRLVSKGRYFDPDQWLAQSPLSSSAFEECYVETAKAVIPNYFRSDTSIGLSLTGGLDTRMILATMAAQDSSMVAYTYAAKDSDTQDVRIARQVAKILDLEYSPLRLGDDFVKEYPEIVDRSIRMTGGTIPATGAHELYFTEQARQISSVRLTGNFGSELLRSMPIDRRLELRPTIFSPEFARAVDAADSVRKDVACQLTDTVFRGIPQQLFGPVALVRQLMTFRTPYLDNAIVKLAYRAPASSRRSSSAALGLIATGAPGLGEIPTDLGYSCGDRADGRVLWRLLCRLTFKLDYWDKDGLPSLVSRFGFGRPVLQGLGLLGWHKYLPYRRWFRFELAGYLRDVFSSEEVRSQPWWEQDELKSLLDDHIAGRRNGIREIDSVVSLCAIQRQLL